jgi:hypothetical protein
VDAKYRGDKILIRLPFIAERTGSFYPFPDHLVFQEKDRMSLLSHQGCRVALAYMHHLASKSVDGMFKLRQEPSQVYTNHTIGILLKSGAQEEWSVRFLECENRIVEIMADGTQNNRVCDHAVMVLTLVDGERYVVDLAGAQYGQYRAVRHLPAYTRDYAHRVVSKNVVGYEDQYHEDQLAGKRIANMPKAYDWCIPMKRKNVTLWLNHKIDAWEDEQHIFVSDMENLKQTDFDVRQEEFLEYYSNQVRELEQGEAALSERDERDGGDEEEREMRALETLPEHMKQSILARKSLKTMSLRARDEFAAKKAGRSEVP